MSISANFPTSGPSLALNFVNSGQLDPRVTFSRATGATWFNSAGVLVGVDFSSTSLTVGTGWQTLTLDATAGVDRNWIVGAPVQLIASTGTNTMTGVVVSYTASTQTLVVSVASVVGSGTYSTWRVSNLSPRFDYDPATLAARGFLIEEARTNLLTYSEQFNTTPDWAVNNATISPNATTAPSGAATAEKLVEDNLNGVHTVAQVGSFVSGTTYTCSVYVKAAERSRIELRAGNTTTFGARAIFDVSSGTVVQTTNGTASIQNAGNGWYRCVIVGVAGATAATSILIYLVESGTTVSYLGDGTSGIYIWGAQLEVGAFPTSYIPTTTTALTRSADVASVNTLSPWFNASEGTLYAEYSRIGPSNFQAVAGISAGASSNSLVLGFGSGAPTNSQRFDVSSGGVSQASITALTNPPLNTVAKTAGAYATNDFAATANGNAPAFDVLGTVPTGLIRLSLGCSSDTTGSFLSGYLRRITYYPRRLSNAELQAITA